MRIREILFKKEIIIILSCLFCVLILWGIFFFFPIVLAWGEEDVLGCLRAKHLNTAYVAAGALFTAFAFGGAVFTIWYQQKNTLKATTLDVFTGIFDKIQNDKFFIRATNYVFYELISYLEKNEELEVGSRELKKIKACKQITAYNYVMYVCKKMEYIGVLIKNEYISQELLNYYGDTIIRAYLIIEPFLLVDKERMKIYNNDKNRKYKQVPETYFIHFTMLYDKAIKLKPKFEKECIEYIKRREIAHD